MQMTITIKNKILFALILFLLTGCFGLFDSGSNRIIGKYIVVWIDLPQDQMIAKEFKLHSSSSSTLLEPYVFAVGHNKHYIIAKQHPTSGFDSGYKIHTDTTNYYIIDIENEKDKIFGPLTFMQFDSLRIKFKIKNIDFDKTYPNDY